MEKKNNSVWTGGMLQPSWEIKLKDRTPFVVTQGSGRNEIGDCVMMLQWPYIVLKVHRFPTNTKDEHANENTEHNRVEWLKQRDNAWTLAYKAQIKKMSIKDFMESRGYHYDEEYDEPRIVGKVPGMNIYLELLGSMKDITYSPTLLGKFGEGEKKCDIKSLRYAVNWACCFYRGTIRKSERVTFGTDKEQWQPLKNWHEDFKEEDDRMFIPREQGIGHNPLLIDKDRRGERYVRHLFTPEEREELNRLKKENANSQQPYTHAQLQQMAVANVRARKLLEE